MLQSFAKTVTEALGTQLLPPLQTRVVLLVNHVLAREPAALQRLAPHAGQRIRIELTGQPDFLPPLPPATVLLTPAGLFELEPQAPADAPCDLRVALALPEPQQLLAALAGEARPRVAIEGDAALAREMQWLVDNVRWDIEGDLGAAIGPLAAHQVLRAGRAVASALRQGLPVAR
jgi:ubiquinone biosynthesis accessory factor UbiJ